LGVDPMVEKTMMSYAYCSNNPIKYIDPDGKEKINFLYKSILDATVIEYRRSNDNNMIHIYAHGNGGHASGFTYYPQNEQPSSVNNSQELNNFLNTYSTIWQNRQSEDVIYIVLHACRTGEESFNQQNQQTEFAFADLVSMDFENTVIVAPSTQVEITIKGETVKNTNNQQIGFWNYYQNGQKIKSEIGLPINNPDLYSNIPTQNSFDKINWGSIPWLHE
jgi:hypothetical protein